MKGPRRLAWLTALSMVAAAWALPHQDLLDAIETQRRTVAERPSAAAWNDLGNLLVRLGSTDEAREAYERALALRESSTLALYNLGLLELELGEVDRARSRFERVLEIEPDHALAHYRLGDVFRLRDRNHKAVVHYAEAFRLDPDLSRPATNPEILFNPLVTWAQMAAYLSPDPGRASRRYGDAGRIARLFVPETVPPPVAPPGEVEEPAAEPMVDMEEQREPSAEPMVEMEGEEAEPPAEPMVEMQGEEEEPPADEPPGGTSD